MSRSAIALAGVLAAVAGVGVALAGLIATGNSGLRADVRVELQAARAEARAEREAFRAEMMRAVRR